MSKNSEYNVQLSLCEHVNIKYPEAVYRSDLGGVRLTMGLAKKMKAIQKPNWQHPDFALFEPRGGYHGLFIELKASKEHLYTKTGKLRNSEHIRGQRRALQALEARGYKAVFAGGIDEAIMVVDGYMALPRN